MKTRNFVAILAATAFLPTFAFAGDNTDPVSASFDRAIYAGYFVESAPAAAADLLDAYVSPVASTKQADVIGPQDVWSGAAYYYAGIALADTDGPQDVWSGAAFPATDTGLADATDPLDAYVSYPAISIQLADAVDPQDVWSGAARYPYVDTNLADVTDPLDEYFTAVNSASDTGSKQHGG